MTAVSGSLVGVTIAGREFTVAASEGAEIHLGGWINTVERNGDGTSRIVQARSSWSLMGAVLSVDNERGDLEYLTAAKAEGGGVLQLRYLDERLALTGGEDIAGLRKFYPIQIELVDGTVFVGKGVPVGKISYDTMNGTARVDFEGDGRLTQYG
jgi:hypothetical protein